MTHYIVRQTSFEVTVSDLNSVNTFYFIMAMIAALTALYFAFGTKQKNNKKLDLKKVSENLEPYVHFYILADTLHFLKWRIQIQQKIPS